MNCLLEAKAASKSEYVIADSEGQPLSYSQFKMCIRDRIKVGLEATGHYSYNLLGFLLDNGLPTYVLKPLRTNSYRKTVSYTHLDVYKRQP